MVFSIEFLLFIHIIHCHSKRGAKCCEIALLICGNDDHSSTEQLITDNMQITYPYFRINNVVIF